MLSNISSRGQGIIIEHKYLEIHSVYASSSSSSPSSSSALRLLFFCRPLHSKKSDSDRNLSVSFFQIVRVIASESLHPFRLALLIIFQYGLIRLIFASYAPDINSILFYLFNIRDSAIWSSALFPLFYRRFPASWN